MGGVSLGSRVKMDLATAQAHSLVEDPTQQGSGVAFAARLGERTEVVDVEEVPPGEVVVRPESAGPAERLVARIDELQRPEGYRLVASFDEAGKAVAAAIVSPAKSSLTTMAPIVPS